MARRSIIPGFPTLKGEASTEVAKRLFHSAFTIRTSGQPYRSGWRTEQAITDGALRSIWTFKAIDAIAKSGAMLPVDLAKGSMPATAETIDPARAPHLWYLLNFKASPWEYSISARYRILSQLLLSPQGVFIEYERGRDGDPKFLQVLNPDKVAPIPDNRTFVSGFEYWNDGNVDIIPADRILWIKIPHPTDPYLSFTPLEAAGISIDLDYYSRLYNRNFMANDGRPGGLVSIKGPIPDADEEVIKARFRNPKPGEITVVESDSIDFADLSTTPRDAAYSQMRKDVRDEILIAFGAPESVLGNASGRTYDNAEAEENIFWRVTMQPLLAFIDIGFSSLTPGGDHDNIWVRHNTSGVRALQRPQREHDQRLLELFREGAITLDELRDGLGRDLFDRPGTTALLIPAGKVAIAASDKEQEALNKLKALGGAGGEAPPEEEVPPPGAPQPGNRFAAMLAARQAPQALGGRVDTARSPERTADLRAVEATATAKRVEVKADQPDGDDRKLHCVMLRVAEDKARHLFSSLPIPADPDPHLTLCVVDGTHDLARVARVVNEWAADTRPLTFLVGPLTEVFDIPGDRPLVFRATGPELEAARADLVARLEAAGTPATGHGATDWKPHVTVSYIAEGVSVPIPDPPVVIRETAMAATLSGVDRSEVDFPLRG